MADGTGKHESKFCWSCRAELAAGARFCSACGAPVVAVASREAARKKGRRNGALVFSAGFAIVLFALIHRNPADIILVVAFALPLCGAGALIWRMG